jgi:hypothetical protein
LSAVAEMRVVPRDQLAELLRSSSDGPEEYLSVLHKASSARILYAYSGWVLVTLLGVLRADLQIDLQGGEKELATALTQSTGATHIVMTSAEKDG